MKTWDDEGELIARCKRELPYKHAAFEILVNRYQDLVFTLCFRLVGRRSIAEELMQEVLMKVFTNLKDFEERSKFSSWIYRIAHNHCLNFINRKSREREVLGEYATEKKIEESGGISEEVSEKLQDALNCITPTKRGVLIMKYVLGLNLQEIGEILEISTGAVKMRLMRARNDFRDIYQLEENDERNKN